MANRYYYFVPGEETPREESQPSTDTEEPDTDTRLADMQESLAAILAAVTDNEEE